MLGSIHDTGSPSPTDLPSTNEAWLDALRGPDRQRTAITAVMQDMPLREVARRMDTNRNALYKVIHDARQKVKDTLEAQYDVMPRVQGHLERCRDCREEYEALLAAPRATE